MPICRLSLKWVYEDGRDIEDTFPLPSDMADFIMDKNNTTGSSTSEIAAKYLGRGIVSEIKEKRMKVRPPPPQLAKEPSAEVKTQEGTEENVQ